MKEQIEKYIRKKRREKIIKILKDNIFVILGAVGILILLIVLKILKKKAKKKIKAQIKDSIKKGIAGYHDLDAPLEENPEEE
jgi:hypothetical protein